MSRKLVFFDIDGTLLDHDKKLPASAKAAIDELKQNGVFVAISTGRAPFMFENLLEELDIDSFVSFNGQYVVFENEVIYKNPLNEQEIGRLLKETHENSHPLVFMTENTMKSSVRHHEYIETSMGSLKIPHPEEDAYFFQNREIYQTLLFCRAEEEQTYKMNYPHFRLIRWHPLSVDILPEGGSKAEGIKAMVDRMGFHLDDVFAFGDGLNDIEMLQMAGTGIAMGNALDEVKKHADYVTRSVGDEGIRHGLRELKLI